MSYRARIIGTSGIAGMGILGLHDEVQIGESKFEASHAGGYHANPDIDLVAVADVDEEKLRRFGDAWDIPNSGQYVGHEAMLESEGLDVVSVCTPTLYHHDHVLAAARSTADPAVIWCEKPIASSVTEASEMIDVCAETDTDLVINHSFRFVEKVQQLRDLLEEACSATFNQSRPSSGGSCSGTRRTCWTPCSFSLTSSPPTCTASSTGRTTPSRP